jgi:hypothetical protein
MVASAPRYDPRLLDALRVLDDRTEPQAAVCRRVGEVAWRLGLTRPSYVHLRRLLVEERRRQDAARKRRRELLQVALDVERDLRRGFRVDAYEIADRVAAINDDWLD